MNWYKVGFCIHLPVAMVLHLVIILHLAASSNGIHYIAFPTTLRKPSQSMLWFPHPLPLRNYMRVHSNTMPVNLVPLSSKNITTYQRNSPTTSKNHQSKSNTNKSCCFSLMNHSIHLVPVVETPYHGFVCYRSGIFHP